MMLAHGDSQAKVSLKEEKGCFAEMKRMKEAIVSRASSVKSSLSAYVADFRKQNKWVDITKGFVDSLVMLADITTDVLMVQQLFSIAYHDPGHGKWDYIWGVQLAFFVSIQYVVVCFGVSTFVAKTTWYKRWVTYHNCDTGPYDQVARNRPDIRSRWRHAWLAPIFHNPCAAMLRQVLVNLLLIPLAPVLDLLMPWEPLLMRYVRESLSHDVLVILPSYIVAKKFLEATTESLPCLCLVSYICFFGEGQFNVNPKVVLTSMIFSGISLYTNAVSLYQGCQTLGVPFTKYIWAMIEMLPLNAIQQGKVDVIKIPYKLSEDSVQLLSGAMKSPECKLTRLILEHCGLTARGVAMLAETLGACQLKELNLYDNPEVGDDGMEALAKALRKPSNLQFIHVGEDGITDKGATLLAEAMAMETSKVTKLVIQRNDIQDEGAIGFARAIGSKTCALKELMIGGNYITKSGAIHLAQAAKKPGNKLNILYLADNFIEDDGTVALAQALHSQDCKLTHLRLMSNGITSKGTVALAKAIPQDTSKGLQELWLQKGLPAQQLWSNSSQASGHSTERAPNNIGEDGAAALAGALEADGCKIKSLAIEKGSVSEAAEARLQEAAEKQSAKRKDKFEGTFNAKKEGCNVDFISCAPSQ